MSFLFRVVLSALTLSFMFSPAHGQNNPDTLSLVSWNVYRANTAIHTNSRNPEDWQLLAGWSEALASKADVIFLQEFDTVGTASSLFGSEFDYYFSHRNRGSVRDSDLQRTAIAVRRSAIDVVSSYEYYSLGVNGGRYGVDLMLENPTSGNRVRILNFHLEEGCQDENVTGSSSNSCRTLVRQYEEIALWVEDRRQEGVPFLLGGTVLRDLINNETEISLLENSQAQEAQNLIALNQGRPDCWNGRFNSWSDYFITDTSALPFVISGSFDEAVFSVADFEALAPKISDHCPILVELNI